MQDHETDGVRKVAELIKDIRTAMLVTLTPQGKPHSRPMATQEAEFDGSVWFLTDVDSGKITDIAAFPTVGITYASSASESYLSLTGKAQVLNDRQRIADFWNSFMKAWFDGPDDPRIRLIRVDIEEAEYWDTPGGKVASLISLAKAAITGKPDDSNETGTVRFT